MGSHHRKSWYRRGWEKSRKASKPSVQISGNTKPLMAPQGYLSPEKGVYVTSKKAGVQERRRGGIGGQVET